MSGAMDSAMGETAPLKLRARTAEDYKVLSALLQDALIPISEMSYLPGERRFVAVANRFRWEMARSVEDEIAKKPVPAGGDARFEDAKAANHFERGHCGLCFDRVKAVRRRGFDPRDPGALLNLLAVTWQPGAVILEFSGGAAVRLEGHRIACHMEDLGEAWPTQWRPSHAAAGLDDDGEAR
jgi:hypothetical protein